MNYLKITNNNDVIKEGYHFTIEEFWKTKFGGCLDFEIPECLVDAAEILREFYGGPVMITSDYRPNDKFGFHRYLNNTGAVDYLPLTDTINNIDKFKNECLNYQNGTGSDLIHNLRSCGVKGFGIESHNCIHLDYRPDINCCDKDEYGMYMVFSWEADGTPDGKSTVYHKITK